MIRLFKRLFAERPEPDLDAFLDDLRAATLGNRYSRMDRYRDFRAVFSNSSTPEQGKRVLWEIFGWCRMYRAVAAPGDPYETYRRDGMRSIGLRILTTLHEEPEERPTRAISESGE